MLDLNIPVAQVLQLFPNREVSKTHESICKSLKNYNVAEVTKVLSSLVKSGELVYNNGNYYCNTAVSNDEVIKPRRTYVPPKNLLLADKLREAFIAKEKSATQAVVSEDLELSEGEEEMANKKVATPEIFIKARKTDSWSKLAETYQHYHDTVVKMIPGKPYDAKGIMALAKESGNIKESMLQALATKLYQMALIDVHSNKGKRHSYYVVNEANRRQFIADVKNGETTLVDSTQRLLNGIRVSVKPKEKEEPIKSDWAVVKPASKFVEVKTTYNVLGRELSRQDLIDLKNEIDEILK